MRISKILLAVATMLVASSSFAGSTKANCGHQANVGRFDKSAFSNKPTAKVKSPSTPAPVEGEQ